jgi:hypothetical protein
MKIPMHTDGLPASLAAQAAIQGQLMSIHVASRRACAGTRGDWEYVAPRCEAQAARSLQDSKK